LNALLTELGDGTFWASLWQTVFAWAAGLAIALVLGTGLGLVLGLSDVLERFSASTIEFLRPIPSVALIPLVVLLYSTGVRSTLVLVVYASLWQVLVQVLYGLHDADPVLRDTANSYGFSRLGQVRYVVWPSALPFVMTGVRLAASVALVLAVTAQLVIGSPGLGSRIATAQLSGALPKMYALTLVTGILGIVINVGARWVGRRSLRWHVSVRSEVAA
jgi:ABC-type nitrate/sulfonate/bicarbonate transport system permease component